MPGRWSVSWLGMDREGEGETYEEEGFEDGVEGSGVELLIYGHAGSRSVSAH